MFVDKVRIEGSPGGYLAKLPVVAALCNAPLQLAQPITVITGENGSGKSTLVEAIAVAAGANAEGGSRNARFSTTSQAVSELWTHLVLTRTQNPRDVFFLRGETYRQLVNYYQSLPTDPLSRLDRSSHGQGLMQLARERFGATSLIVLDEPEDGLSIFAQLELLGILYHLTETGAQVIMATHSPILLGIPDAQLVETSAEGIRNTTFGECEEVAAWQEFIADPIGTAHFIVEP